MSLRENIEQHWDELSRKQSTIAEALSWSINGRNLQRAAKVLAKAPIMQQLSGALSSDTGSSVDRFKMAQYLGLALENEPEINIGRFIDYLEQIIGMSMSPERAAYYSGVKDAVQQLQQSSELSNYLAMYQAFEMDSTHEVTLARHIMLEISRNTQKIMGEYS